MTSPIALSMPGGVESFLVAVLATVGLPLAIFAVGHLFDTYLMEPWDGTDPEARLNLDEEGED